MATAIQVENLSKAYQLGIIGTGTISRDLERWWITSIRGKEDPFLRIGETNDRAVKGKSDIVWSLKDINFEIEQGNAVGIIGRNGAGKSTLLKILSEITSPTTGKINIKGRIASLLEVGTGFHPELTGRENIFLNGAILGMRKKEIQRKLEEIIDFSGVERYVDTPVKRYSSGMYVRLAFAVAAHLESEILVVDEVLAVGDAEFQKKCLGKMGDISKGEGRTVLFVSHNMAAIQSLCNRGLCLENGKVDFFGNTKDCINRYLVSSNLDKVINELEQIKNRSGSQEVIFSSFHIENSSGQVIDVALSGESVTFVFKVKMNNLNSAKIDIGFSLHNSYDEIESYLYSSFQDIFFNSDNEVYKTVKCVIKDFAFSKGRLFVKGRILANGGESDWPKETLGIVETEMGDFYKTGQTTENLAPFLIKGIWE